MPHPPTPNPFDAIEGLLQVVVEDVADASSLGLFGHREPGGQFAHLPRPLYGSGDR